mmetsp:Transcript_87204/g.244085  ORF Transcript_87204/g.244085 Transcript_87204/m.244085 type:complete len:387 (-) Transcript_87204:61-1221(-)
MAPRRAPLPRALLLAAGGVLVGANCSDDAAACAAEATDSLMLLQRGSESHLVSADWGPRKRKDRTPVVVDWPGADAQVPMKDVVKSFMMMSPAGSAFSLTTGRQFPAGYSRGYPPYSEHFQGVQRYGKYIYVSGSGETASQAQIIVCEVESRSDVGPMARGSDSGPKSGDRVVKTVSFDREFWHAGGFSIFGSTLVVGTEAGCSTTDRMLGRCEKASRIFFFDLADPANPSQLPYILERKGGTAGAVALTQEADGRFLLMVGGVLGAGLDAVDSLDEMFAPLIPWAMFGLMGATVYAMWKKQQQQTRPQLSQPIAYGPVGAQPPPQQELPVVQAVAYNPGGVVAQGGRPMPGPGLRQHPQGNALPVVQAVPVPASPARTQQALRMA